MFDLNKKNIKKILIVTLSNLGDMILTLPVVAAFKKKFPKAKVHIVGDIKSIGMLENAPAFDKVFVYDKKARLKDKTNLILKLRKEKYDFTVDFRNSAFPYLVGKPSNSLLVNYFVKKVNSRYEQARKRIDLYNLQKADYSFVPLFREADENAMRTKLHSYGLFNFQNLLIIAPGSRSGGKCWPSEYFVEVIQKIYTQYEMPVILVGDSFDREVCDKVEACLEECDVINLSGKITQKELAVVVSKARLVLSNDSAVMHLGNFYEKYVVGIFGPSSTEKYGYVGEKARVVKKDLPDLPFESVKPEKVWSAVQELLG